MANIPPRNGNPTSYRDINLGDEARRLWGPDYYQPDTAYVFSNGRRFDSSDRGKSGVYGVTVVSHLLLDPVSNYPDMAGYAILLDQGGYLGQG